MLDRLARRPVLSALLAVCLSAGAGGTLAVGQETGPAPRERAVASPEGPLPGQEIVSQRTATSRTWATENGAMRSRFYADDVNYRGADGAWRKIDSSLVPSDEPGYAHRNAANSWTVDLPGRLGARPVRVRDGERWVSFGLEGAQAEAAVAANEARFAGAFPGVDVEYAARGRSVKETLTLASRRSQSTFSFAVDASAGLLPREIASGAVEFRDAAGALWFSFAPPYMEDSQGARSDAVDFEVERAGAGWTLALTADRAWLEAADRGYPVVVDPTTQLHGDAKISIAGTDEECRIISGTYANTSFCNDGDDLEAGYNGSVRKRSIFQFSGIQDYLHRDTLVLEARVGLFVGWRHTSNNTNFSMHKVTDRQINGYTTWNKYDGTNNWTTAGGDFSATAAATKSVNNTGWHYWPITDLVQDWADESSPNLGMLLKQDNETVAANQELSISHSDGGDLMPYIEVLHVPRGGTQPHYTMHSEQLNDRMGVSVNVASGNLILQSHDLHIPGTAGHDLDIVRTYNSIPGGWDGWGVMEMNTGADVELEELTNGDVVFWGPNAQVAKFKKKQGTSPVQYEQPTGLNATLTPNSPNTGEWTLRYLKSEEKLIFNSSEKLTKHKDRNGNELTFAYTTEGWLDSITDSQGRVTDITLTTCCRKMVKKLIDPAGREHVYGYNSTTGYLETYTDPAGGVTTYTWAMTGQQDRLTQVQDPRGHITKFTYLTGCVEWQEPCRVTKIERTKVASPAAYDVTTFEYNAGDSPCPNATETNKPKVVGHTVITDARGNATSSPTTDGKTTHCYDREMRVVWTKDQEGHVTKNDYTANSDVEKYTPGAGTAHSTTATHDSSNRISSLVKPKDAANNEGATTTFDYASQTGDSRPAGSMLPTNSIDSMDKQWNYRYTANSNLKSARQGTTAGTNVPAVEVDYHDGETGEANNGTVEWTEDGNDNRTIYTYTSGNLTRVDPPAGSGQGEIDIAYEANISRISSITDGKEQRREFSYDGLDRVTQVRFYNASNVLTQTDTYTYDGNGNQLTRSDASGSYTYAYDPQNRMTSEARPGAFDTTYTYDPVGNLSSMTHASDQVTYAYTGDNLISELKEPGSPQPTTTFTYDSNHNRTGTTFANGVVESASFDNADRPNVMTASKSGTTLVSLDYDFMKLDGTSKVERDLIQKVVDNRGTAATTAYTYDDVGRVTDVDTTGGRSEDWHYEYDGASNRTKKVDGATNTFYKYDEGNELCWRNGSSSTNNCATTPTGGVGYTHDENGATTASTGGFSASYNVLAQTSVIGGTAMEYAGEGQAERTGSGSLDFGYTRLGLSSQGTGTSITHFRRDDKGSLVGQKLDTGARYYYHRDALGSVLSMTNSSGTEANRYIYNDAYGEDLTTTGSTANPWKFAGEYQDTSDRYKIGERYYIPSLGRWTQKDPIMQALDARQANPYAYAADDPVNLTDPSGEALPLVGAVAARAAPYVVGAAVRWGATQYARRQSGRTLASWHNRISSVVTGRAVNTGVKIVDKAGDLLGL